MVIWQQFQDRRDFLPRLGGKILLIQTSREGDRVAVVTEDNKVSIINIHNSSIQFSIQGLQQNQLSANTVYQRNQSSLVSFAGREGRIQLFDLRLGLVQREIATVLRNTVIASTKSSPLNIVDYAFSEDFKLLAVLLQRQDDNLSLSQLKFY